MSENVGRPFDPLVERMGDSMETYKVVRFTFDDNDPDNHRVIRTGLTLDEAQEHCQREDTHGEGWFDGYDSE